MVSKNDKKSADKAAADQKAMLSARGQRWRMATQKPAVAASLGGLKLSTGAATLIAQRSDTAQEARALAETRNFSQFLKQDWPVLSGLKDLDRAAQRLADAIESGQKIGISGDYDCDGNSSVALLLRFLSASGVAMDRVHVHIPNREMEGYGVNAQAVDAMLAENMGLLLTLDNGTSAYEPIRKAAQAGLDVIVADHHGNHAADGLPRALVINPNRHDEKSLPTGTKDLAAVSVTFLMCMRTLEVLKSRGHYARLENPALRTPPDPASWLGLVALATVGDVVSLKSPLNRLLVREGLNVINQRRDPLLVALAETAQCSLPIDEEDIAFTMAPIVNAPGRLGQSVAWAFLSGASFDEAQQAHQRKKLLSGIADIEEARARLDTRYSKRISRADVLPETEGLSMAEQNMVGERQRELDALEARFGAAASLREARLLMLLSKECNGQRKALEADLLREARAQMREQLALNPKAGTVLVTGRGWHPGLIGIVAGRLKEECGLPVVVGSIDDTQREFKCSARSILDVSGGADIGHAFRELRQQGHLDKAGGHPMAAGGSFVVADAAQMQQRVQQLRTALERQMGKAAQQVHAQATQEVNGMLDLASWQKEYQKKSVSALLDWVKQTDAHLRPYGQNNPRPLLAVPHAYISGLRPSRDGKHLFFDIRQSGCDITLPGVAFHVGGTVLAQALEQGCMQPIHLLGTLSVNAFSTSSGTKEKLQFRLDDACLKSVDMHDRQHIECMTGPHNAAALEGITRSARTRGATR